MQKRSSLAVLVGTCAVTALTFGDAAAGLVRQSHIHGCGNEAIEETLVFDDINRTWWYPDLMAMTDKTRNQQTQAIGDLNRRKYGNISEWRMASLEQVNRLKSSLADMATVKTRLPWNPANLRGPDPLAPDSNEENRTIFSPYLAWEVKPQDFFTPTGQPGLTLMGQVPALAFNGRTADVYGWRRNSDGSTTFSKGGADDHFMALQIANPGKFDTMIYNDDAHELADDATDRPSERQKSGSRKGEPPIGGVGAWVASETRPEYLGLPVTLETNSVANETSVLIGGREWLDAALINPRSVTLKASEGVTTAIPATTYKVQDLTGDGINDLRMTFDTSKSDVDHATILLSGFLKEEYGYVSIRGIICE